MGSHTDAHYEDVAKGYEGAFFYESGPYQDWLLSTLLSHLAPSSEHRVVDLGGGTGNFTAALAAAAALTQPVLCVDNSAPMLAVAAGRPGVIPREQDAVAFARSTDAQSQGYDRVLLKELVHHIPEADAAAMYAGLAAQLAPGGLCVTVTRPQEVEYPLWGAARAVWRAAQPPVERIAAQAAAGGQLRVRVEEAVYTARMPKARWFGMVRARFWSTFSQFDDAALEAGIAEVDAATPGSDEVTFRDRLLIVIAAKPDACDLSDGALSAATLAAAAAAFARDGVLPRARVLSAAAAGDALAAFQRYEAACGGAVAGERRFKAHLMLPWLWQLAHRPALVALVAAALGSDDVALWSTDIFAKEPGDGALTTWHQDATYVALHPPEGLTLWLALTPSQPESGAVEFLPGSHAGGQRPHARGRGGPRNMLLAGQEAELSPADAASAARGGVIASLAPGEASLHHLLTVHRSGANASASRRVGIALRYMTARVTQQRVPRDSVAVCGEPAAFSDRYALESAPAAELDAAGCAAHARAVATVHPDAAAAP